MNSIVSDSVKAKTFDFSTIKGMTSNQLEQHYKLYAGYVKKINEIWNTSNDANNFTDSNTTYSKMRSLKLGETFALNGVKLHELYFENICGNSKTPQGNILNLINQSYGSYDNFIKYFKNVGLSMRGWTIAAIDPLDNKIHIFGADAHDVGAVWLSYPLLVMDVYEHAYMIDFGIDRSKYINIFVDNINWGVVNERLGFYNKMKPEDIKVRNNVGPTYYPSWRI